MVHVMAVAVVIIGICKIKWITRTCLIATDIVDCSACACTAACTAAGAAAVAAGAAGAAAGAAGAAAGAVARTHRRFRTGIHRDRPSKSAGATTIRKRLLVKHLADE